MSLYLCGVLCMVEVTCNACNRDGMDRDMSNVQCIHYTNFSFSTILVYCLPLSAHLTCKFVIFMLFAAVA